MRSSAKMNCASCKYAFLNMFVVPCCNCNGGSEFKPKTNADRVRTMTDQELAEAFAMISDCMSCNCRNAEDDCSIVDGTCQQQWLKWLQQEV